MNRSPSQKGARQPIFLDAPVGDNGNLSIGDFTEDQAAEDTADMANPGLLKLKLDDVLALLTARELKIIECASA